jgi:hypothetical protein
MKADWNDAPEYIKASSHRSGANAWIIPGIIGTCITLGLLQVAGSAFLNGTVQSLTHKSTRAKPAPVAHLTRQDPVTEKDWDRIVDDQAKRDQAAQLKTTPNQIEATNATAKQAVFNDSNYIPRGADNVVSLIEPAHTAEKEKPAGKMKVTIIKQEPSMKDRACWPHKEGSIERRDCRSSIGLNYRD